MAERIVSPGVFTEERDLSFLPQGISDIGAAIIGPTEKGPAFTPTILSNFQEFENTFGKVSEDYYVPYTVQEYLKSASSVTIVRVLGIGGYKTDYVNIVASGSSNEDLIAVLAPSRGAGAAGIDGTRVMRSGVEQATGWYSDATTAGDFVIHISGSTNTAGTYHETISASFATSSDLFIDKVISSDPMNNTSNVYLYKIFKETAHNNHQSWTGLSVTGSSSASAGQDFVSGTGYSAQYGATGVAATWTGNSDYSVARTPIVIDQGATATRSYNNLFRIYSLSHGTSVNEEFKVCVLNIKAAGSIPGSDYGEFSVQVRKNNPAQADDNIVLEQFDNCNFDRTSNNYFARKIGDRFVEIDSNGKLTYKGDWPNQSKWIRVGDYADLKNLAKTVVPFGFEAVNNPVLGANVPTITFKSEQKNSVGDFDQNVFYGFDYKLKDNREYLAPIPYNATTGSNSVFSLANMNGDDNAAGDLNVSTAANSSTAITLANSDIAQRKFVMPLQWGFDGDNPTKIKATGNDISGTNTQGFDLSSAAASGSVAYKRAINAISNPDEFDINLLAIPGVLHSKGGSIVHSAVTNHAISKIEARGDAFYVLDGFAWSDSIDNATNGISALDTNYAGTYFPWVKVVDSETQLPVWVPPSVVLPGVISFTDKIAHEWFAPAGLNRGGLTSVLEAKTRLTHAERDKLYENRVNPIATFPGQGVTVFGQKTLQSKPSALDRINVRRLLIALKKFIASSSRYLVFEQNTTATRNRFLNIVNPYLESVQANSGLNAFRVVMDDSNNTPDVVDRNRLVGQIFIQPTRTAEFIVLDFVVLPTGASFPD